MKTAAVSWLSASSLLLFSQSPLLTNAGKTLTSDEKHALKREAMHAAVQADAFASDEERRSYYYFHAGVENAARNAMKMAGRDVGDLAEFDEDEDIALLQYLEEALVRELESIRAQSKVEHDDGEYRSQPEGDAKEAGPADDKDGPNKKYSGPESYVNEINVPADRRIEQIFDKEYLHFQCGNQPDILPTTPIELQGKWNEMRRHFWELVVGRPPPHEDGYVPNPDLYVDFVLEDDGDGNIIRRRGLFAARDFKRLEEVHSQKHNRLYFPDIAAWAGFLHALPSNHDVCLALESSFMKQISRPGRWLVGLALNEEVFMATSDEEKDSEDDEGEEDSDDDDDDSDDVIGEVLDDGTEKDDEFGNHLKVNTSPEDDWSLKDSEEQGDENDVNDDNGLEDEKEPDSEDNEEEEEDHDDDSDDDEANNDEKEPDSEDNEEEEEDYDDDSDDDEANNTEDGTNNAGSHFNVIESLENDSGLEDNKEKGDGNEEGDGNDADSEAVEESEDDDEEDDVDDDSDDDKDNNIGDEALEDNKKEEDNEDNNDDNDKNNEKDIGGKRDGKRSSDLKANVSLDDDRSLDFIALKNIKRGEEIVQLKIIKK